MAGIAILAVVVGAGVWLLADSGQAGPNLGDKLVDGQALEACLRDAPRPAAEEEVVNGCLERAATVTPTG